MTKTCPRCKTERSVAEFSSNRTKANGLQVLCKVCQRAASKAHYYANKQDYVDRAGARKKVVAQFVRDAKRKPCADCRIEYPFYVMEFDHARGQKEFTISRAYLKKSVNQLAEEMMKCDVVCANCHHERTYQRALATRIKK